MPPLQVASPQTCVLGCIDLHENQVCALTLHPSSIPQGAALGEGRDRAGGRARGFDQNPLSLARRRFVAPRPPTKARAAAPHPRQHAVTPARRCASTERESKERDRPCFFFPRRRPTPPPVGTEKKGGGNRFGDTSEACVCVGVGVPPLSLSRPPGAAGREARGRGGGQSARG